MSRRSSSKDSGPSIEGYLDKKAASGMHAWQKKYFVAKKGKLVYWKNESDRNTSGSNYKTVSLRGAKVKKVRKEGSTNSNEFVVITTEKEYHLRANTAKEMSNWKEKLTEVINYKKSQKSRNSSMVASAAQVPFIEAAMQVTIPGTPPRDLWVRVNKLEKKMTFAESEKRMNEGKANVAGALQLDKAQLSKHGSREFRLHVLTPTKRTYSFQLADKADLNTWVSALLLLDITFLSRGEAEGTAPGAVPERAASGSSGRRSGNSSAGFSGGPKASASNPASGSGVNPTPEPVRAIMVADWIRDFDELVANRKRQDAVMIAFTAAERFFQMDNGGDPSDDQAVVRENEELDVHQTVECAERLIDDLNVRYNDCHPDRMDLFELYLAQYNNRLITQLDMIGVSSPECLAEYTPEELKMVIQLLTTYLNDVVYPAIEGTTIGQRVLVDKFETDKHVLIEAFTDKALAIITDILRRSCKKLLTMDPEVFNQRSSNILRTVTVNDIFRVVLNQLEISEECEVVALNNNMIFSCIKAIQTYTLVVASYLPIMNPDLKFMCAIANDFMALREELIKLLHDKRSGNCGYDFEERLRLLGIAADDPNWAVKMFEQSKDLDNVFADIANAQRVAIHSLLDFVFKRLDFSMFFTRFDRREPYDRVFDPLKRSIFPKCAEYFGQTENMKLVMQLCADHCQINYYQALFRRIRQNDEIKGKFWIKKFELSTERIGCESKREDFFRYFRDVNAGRLRSEFRRRDRDEQGSLALDQFMEMLQPYLPEGRDAPFKDWLMEEYCSEKNKDTSKSRIDYLAFTERIRQLESEHEAQKNGTGLNNFKHRSLIHDFHKFEDFFRGRVVQYLPEEKTFFSRMMVPRLNVFKDITDILGSSGKREGNTISLPNASISLVSVFKNHEKCLDEVLQAAIHCFNAKTEVEVEIPQGATGGAKSGVAGFLNAVGGGGKKVRGGDNERPREICRMTKEIRATVIERSEELHRTWVTKTRKKVLNTHEYRLDKMNDVFWQIIHEAGPESKEHLLVGRNEYRAHNKTFAFNFSFVERHDFPEPLTADERIVLAADDPENTATVTGNLDDWGI